MFGKTSNIIVDFNIRVQNNWFLEFISLYWYMMFVIAWYMIEKNSNFFLHFELFSQTFLNVSHTLKNCTK